MANMFKNETKMLAINYQYGSDFKLHYQKQGCNNSHSTGWTADRKTIIHFYLFVYFYYIFLHRETFLCYLASLASVLIGWHE